MGREDNRCAIVVFNIDEVASDEAKAIDIFTRIDDGLDMSLEFRKTAAKSLFDRIVINNEVHLLAVEADFVRNQAPEFILGINYYE
ncbi:hypothetical protein [Marinibactrum halimedae]|uniref:Uncharacterized protein n=1 Tax=Marinibactrum halimedae TaxID=1444977 RepID=A0AA37T9S0_9GAMM|nr:hypothetical protein [Marinibactrum halimedae]MCD9459450.1 hypothetical protein [Marinibactrum halimedae]GLS28104.1 hypothetical protein GCM10007877_38230 [Marinibactrum halimedae]